MAPAFSNRSSSSSSSSSSSGVRLGHVFLAMTIVDDCRRVGPLQLLDSLSHFCDSFNPFGSEFHSGAKRDTERAGAKGQDPGCAAHQLDEKCIVGFEGSGVGGRGTSRLQRG